MPQRSGAACCFYQKVEGEVKNLIPPPPDNYMSLGTVSLSDIPLYMTTSHCAGLLTISAIAGDRVPCKFGGVFVCTSMFTCTATCSDFAEAPDIGQRKPPFVVPAVSYCKQPNSRLSLNFRGCDLHSEAPGRISQIIQFQLCNARLKTRMQMLNIT